ncbi:Riboflavin kinase [Spironucleus salmonicida]|uniref:riboflavin kinase n=1 Tax=Spironucleus salmonicida TaxID=348837 RepID=V6LPV1_9EUKA|nr:Riboflavin kinase [Spironucleus salmonicida]|eukprot:EST45736.1 Riboflavin kinase, FMN adenylyltransferase [Spironucleus salmonicida]
MEFSSLVQHGFKVGRQIGYPTANVLGALDDGVYAGTAILRGVVYNAVIFSGISKTFQREHKTVEAHILHKFDGDFYGEELKLVIVKKLRDNQQFSNIDELKQQIQIDCKQVAELQ